VAANATDQRPLFDNWRKSQNLAASSVREKSCKELTGVNVLQLNFAPCLQSILRSTSKRSSQETGQRSRRAE